MMQDLEYDEYSKQFEDTCKRIAPQRRLRVWRSEEAQKRMAKPGSLQASQGVPCYPNYLTLELSLNVDGVEYLRVIHENIMAWILRPEEQERMARYNVDYIISRIAREL